MAFDAVEHPLQNECDEVPTPGSTSEEQGGQQCSHSTRPISGPGSDARYDPWSLTRVIPTLTDGGDLDMPTFRRTSKVPPPMLLLPRLPFLVQLSCRCPVHRQNRVTAPLTTSDVIAPVKEKTMRTEQTGTTKVGTSEMGTRMMGREIQRRGQPRALQAFEFPPSDQRTPQGWTKAASTNTALGESTVEVSLQVSLQVPIAIGVSDHCRGSDRN